jgi:tetratricopeptide (TPR) repeat protein
MADHYAYVPLIGLFIVVVWGATECLERRHIGQALRWSFVLAGLAILSFLTYRQVGYWQDGVTVLSHAFQVTSGNLQVEKQLANAMVRQGDIEGAVPHLLNIAQKDPQDATNLINLGSYYASAGRARDAMRQFEAVIRLTDHLAPNQRNQQFRSYALLSLGFAYITLGDFPRALTNFEAANKSDPITVNRTIQTVGQSLTSAPSEAGALKLSLLLKTKSEDKEASSLLQDAIEANPDYKDARALLNYLNGESK